MKKYEYNILPKNSSSKFKTICSEIEETYPELKKDVLLVSKKPIEASKEELDNNKRSSSAKLRVVEKL